MNSDKLLSRFKPIRTFFFDVDGVLTDGTLIISSDGALLRTMHARDGMAMRIALDQGYQIVIITGGKSEGVVQRLRGLGVRNIHIGIHDKKAKLEELLYEFDWKKEEMLYVGDDINDYEIMQEMGLACCPSDAAEEIKRIADYISPIKGGRGCVRDVIEKVLKLNNHWMPFPQKSETS